MPLWRSDFVGFAAGEIVISPACYLGRYGDRDAPPLLGGNTFLLNSHIFYIPSAEIDFSEGGTTFSPWESSLHVR